MESESSDFWGEKVRTSHNAHHPVMLSENEASSAPCKAVEQGEEDISLCSI
jgi:hypothetical protein